MELGSTGEENGMGTGKKREEKREHEEDWRENKFQILKKTFLLWDYFQRCINLYMYGLFLNT